MTEEQTSLNPNQQTFMLQLVSTHWTRCKWPQKG